METFLIKAIQLLLSLSILVAVHEFGHFIFARIFKVRVEKFYLFFDPWFSLFKYKPKNSDTEYGIGWLPLGGYCKISGMIDESMDKEQMAKPAEPYEFRAKPAGQRLMIMIAGVVFNFILALFIYSMVLFTWGDSYIPLNKMNMGMYYSETAKQVGFQDGDQLVAVDGVVQDRFNPEVFAKAAEITINRNGEQIRIIMPEDFIQRMMRDKKGFAGLRYPMVVEAVSEDMAAAKAGIQANDSIISINGKSTPTFEEVAELFAENKGEAVEVGFIRTGTTQSLSVTTDSLGRIGVFVRSPAALYGIAQTNYGFFESFPAGVSKGVNTLKGYVTDMKYVFTKEGAASLGGFGTIGGMFPASFDWQVFWERTAFLSIILAFMNILPIPALDGGHVMFLLYEVIARRKPSDKFMEYAQLTGMFLLFGLLLYANGNDLFRYFFN